MALENEILADFDSIHDKKLDSGHEKADKNIEEIFGALLF